MAVDYTGGDSVFEIDVPGAPVEGVLDEDGDPIFFYRIMVRRKKEQGAGDPWKTLMDVGGKRPCFAPSSKKALERAKEWLDDYGETLP